MKTNVIIGIILIVATSAYFLFLTPAKRKEVRKEVRSAAYYARYKAMEKTGALPALDNLQAARQCRENLARIESAKRAAAEKLNITTGTVPLDAILRLMGLAALPKCPAGGEYTVGQMGFAAKCSIGGNETTKTDDDHIIQGY